MKKNIIAILGVVIILIVGSMIIYQRDAKKASTIQNPSSTESSSTEQKILYYRNPMGLADTSPTPKKDSMGMEYIPVYEGEATPANQVKISLDKMQKIGVQTEVLTKKILTKTIRVTGMFQANERHEHVISPKFSGWVDTLYVNTTGQVVKQNEPLMAIYSPELISAQQDFLLAQSTLNNNQPLVDAALQRLRYWGISDDQLQRLIKENKVQTITLNSPINGVVIEKNVTQGMRFAAGDSIYRITDLSMLWVMAEIYEQDLSLVQTGQVANIHVNAYPNTIFKGKIDYIYPTVNPTTRTTQIRIELPNPNGDLKPDMYANVELKAQITDAEVLAVSNSAVIEGGIQNVVLVQRAEGLFEPIPVKLGLRTDNYTEVLSGLNVGDQVVIRANFLIDAESNLKAALNNLQEVSTSGAQ